MGLPELNVLRATLTYIHDQIAFSMMVFTMTLKSYHDTFLVMSLGNFQCSLFSNN